MAPQACCARWGYGIRGPSGPRMETLTSAVSAARNTRSRYAFAMAAARGRGKAGKSLLHRHESHLDRHVTRQARYLHGRTARRHAVLEVGRVGLVEFPKVVQVAQKTVRHDDVVEAHARRLEHRPEVVHHHARLLLDAAGHQLVGLRV